MKTIGCFIATALFVTSVAFGAVLKDVFFRKPGRYILDAEGSTITITREPSGSWSLKATWHLGDSTTSAAANEAICGDEWFVYIENPNRIWVFNGVDEALLLSHSEKESGTKSFTRGGLRQCPPKFREALPKDVREKYAKRIGLGSSSFRVTEEHKVTGAQNCRMV